MSEGEEAAIHVGLPRGDERFDIWPEGVSTLREYLAAAWRWKWIALVPLVALPLLTLLASTSQQNLYEASADVLVNRQEAVTTTLVGQTPALDSADRAMSTDARLARIPVVIERTLAAAGASDRSEGELLGHSEVTPLSDILRFTVSDGDPSVAARLASAYAGEFVRYRRQLDTESLARTLAELRAQMERRSPGSPPDLTLIDRVRQLEALRALRVSNITVVRSAEPGDAVQIAPRPRRDAAIALAGGLVGGLVLVFLAESLRTRPRSRAEFEALLDIPLLAHFRRIRATTVVPPVGQGADLEADAAHTLRTHLERLGVGRDIRTVIVTSPSSAEAKSTVIAQLAVALARAGRQVALIDVDFRHAGSAHLFGLEQRPGVAEVLRGECRLAEALNPISLEALPTTLPSRNGERSDAMLEVLGSGALSGHPAELLSSAAFGALIAELELRADVVLVDVAPVIAAPDAAATTEAAQGMLLVVSTRDADGATLAGARRAVDGWPVVKLGFVLAESGSRGRISADRLRRPGSTHAEALEQEPVA